MTTPAIAIFDIGKTNKKLFLFDEKYEIIDEQTKQLNETTDEDGHDCEDIRELASWVKNSLSVAIRNFNVKAINISAYGASFVHLDQSCNLLTPIYSYLKPYPESLQKRFYNTYGGETKLSLETASPVLGSLNSGLQLYRLKYQNPDLFEKIHYSLHLPQYISHLITSKTYADITSIGCHTLLWNFKKNSYHEWVLKENIDTKLPTQLKSNELIPISQNNQSILVGIGLHDSSAALIPYLTSFQEPFILISTGTWCISFNPFNSSPLTEDELKSDCLCYLSHEGNPIKASRLFAGHHHEIQVKRMSAHFNKADDYYKSISFNSAIISGQLKSGDRSRLAFDTVYLNTWPSLQFESRDLTHYSTYEEAYHQLIMDIVALQFRSTELVIKNSNVNRIFVDGGFSKNSIYMNLLAAAFPNLEVFGATVAQASALGAALALHYQWNKHPIPGDLIQLRYFSAPKKFNT